MAEGCVAAAARIESSGEGDTLNGCLVRHIGRGRRRVRFVDGKCERVSGLVAVAVSNDVGEVVCSSSVRRAAQNP